MKPNVMYIVLDGLSEWYVNEYSRINPDCFFEKMKHMGYSCEKMYSCGPFTEAALNAIAFGRNTFDTKYVQNNLFLNEDNIFTRFSEAGYETYKPNLFVGGAGMSELIYKDKDFTEDMLNETFWLGIDYLSSLKRRLPTDLESAICLLEHFFLMNTNEAVLCEKEKFEMQKGKYATELLDNKSEHILYKLSYFSNGGVDGGTFWYKEAMKEGYIEEELTLQNLLFMKNIDIYSRMYGKDNKTASFENDLMSNRDIRESMNLFGSRQYIDASFEKGSQRVWEWLRTRQKDSPYFCYFHSLDFHFPSIMTKYVYGDKKYSDEVRNLIKKAKGIDETGLRMSIVKYLSIDYLSGALEDFYGRLVKEGYADNTYIVVMADHGISNFMYPLTGKERWTFCNMLFQIPFFLLGKDIPLIRDNQFRSEQDIMPSLIDICNLSNEDVENHLLRPSSRMAIEAEWINGRIDFLRSKLKFGIRDDYYSITIGLYLHQFFDSYELLAIYDLKKDPNEVENLVLFPTKADESRIESLIGKIKERYFEICKRLYSENYYFGAARNDNIASLFENEENYYSLSQYIKVCDIDEFNKIACDKKIYIFGAVEKTKQLLMDNLIQQKIVGILDNAETKKGTFICGHEIIAPFYFDNEQNNSSIVLVVGSYELEITKQLKELNILNCYIWRQIENSEIFGKLR